LDEIANGSVSRKVAKQVLEHMWSAGKSAAQVIKEQGLGQISDASALTDLIKAVIAANPDQVASYRDGNDKMFNYFVGQVMKQTKGQANPVQTKQVLEEYLNE